MPGPLRALPTAVALPAIAALALLLYASTLRFPFLLDDIRNVANNPAVRMQELGPEALWRAAFESPTPRAVANVSFALGYYLGAVDPPGQRLVNVAIHALNGMLVFALALATYRRAAALRGWPPALADESRWRWAAFFAALLFVAHPLQTQSVTYVVQRMTSLATALYLAAFLCFLRGRSARGARQRWTWWSVAAFGWALAVGSKEIAIVLPFALWLYVGYFERDLDRPWLRWTPAVLALGVAGLVALLLLHPSGWDAYTGRGFTLGERLLTQLRAVWVYVGLVLLPLPSRLNLLHDLPLSHSLVDPPTTLLAAVALLALLAAMVALARRLRLLSFAIAWFLLHLALESSVLPLAMVFEHRTYLPLVGVALAAPVVLVSALRAPWRAGAVCALLVVLLGAGTLARNPVWRSAEALWGDVVAKSPQSARAHDELGLALVALGQLEEAIGHYREAVRLDPLHPQPRLHLGYALVLRGEEEAGVASMREALRLDPENAPAHQALAMLAMERGRLDEAASHMERAVALRPDDALVQSNAARLAYRRGRLAEAARHFARALELDPDSAVTRNNFAWLLATSPDPQLRDPARAIALAEAVRDAGGARDPQLLDTLAAAYAAAGRFQEAERTAAAAALLAERAGDASGADAIRRRRALYAEGRAYREGGAD